MMTNSLSTTNTWNGLAKDLDRFFNDAWNPAWATSKSMIRSFTPSCDVEETDTHFLLSFDLPGVKKEDVHVEVHEGRLMISGERKRERENTESSAYFSERTYGRFERAFTLGKGVKAENIEAGFENGVLTIALPKAEMAKPKQIKIQEGKGGILSKLKKVSGEAA